MPTPNLDMSLQLTSCVDDVNFDIRRKITFFYVSDVFGVSTSNPFKYILKNTLNTDVNKPAEGHMRICSLAKHWPLSTGSPHLCRFSTAWYDTLWFSTVHLCFFPHWVQYLVPGTFLVPPWPRLISLDD